MPSVFLSPSVQEFNPYIIGGSEEYYMNLVADAMIPYLEASGISYDRNDPNGSLSEAIARSNAGGHEIHLAIHSNSSPESLAGSLQGPDIYYYKSSEPARRLAGLAARNLRPIYPNPALVTELPTTGLAELRRTAAPAILVEVAYHDNYDDATWIVENIRPIARALSQTVAEFLGVPFVDPYAPADR